MTQVGSKYRIVTLNGLIKPESIQLVLDLPLDEHAPSWPTWGVSTGWGHASSWHICGIWLDTRHFTVPGSTLATCSLAGTQLIREACHDW